MTMQAIFVPAVGIMGNDFDRVILICIGSLCWGGMSVGFGFARDLKQVSQNASNTLHMYTSADSLCWQTSPSEHGMLLPACLMLQSLLNALTSSLPREMTKSVLLAVMCLCKWMAFFQTYAKK